MQTELHGMHYRAYIVEDSPTIRDNLIEALSEMAAVEPVGTADTEREGKRWLSQNRSWDLAIIDLFLREGSGLNVLEALRGRRLPGQKLIVLSNHATEEVRWRCTQLGADAVFDKSTEIEALVDYCVQQRQDAETRPQRE